MEKASGGTAGDVMTSPALTIRDDASLVEAARLMADHRVKRLPVVDVNGRMVGIVSRFDLVRVFVRSDDDIRDEIKIELAHRVLLTEPGAVHINVGVENGVVELNGELDRRSSAIIATKLAQRTNGVVDVVDKLSFRHDDVEGRAAHVFG
jgi:CBS domain-containing protein